MPKDAQATRERIVAAGNDLILRQGFAATSLDQILEQAKVTKGAFFHHFASKAELGEELMQRFLAQDRELMDELFARAEQFVSDPLQQVLVALGLVREKFAALDEPPPGCLIAAYCYQEALMTETARRASAELMKLWRQRFAEKLRAAAELHTLRAQVDLDDVGDLVNTVIEGAFVMSKTMDEPALIPRQIDQLRTYIALLFGVPPPVTPRNA
jgi:AcrR family transcriptional regulator